MLIIVDMISSWKNILWFQRVSEHVLELGHYEIRVKGMHYSFWLCEKKKHILYILSFRCSWKYTCTVYFFLLIHRLVRHSSLASHLALCLLKTKKGGALIWLISSYFTVKMCHVYLKESTYRPTVWPIAIKYTVFLFVEHFVSVGVAGEIIWLW